MARGVTNFVGILYCEPPRDLIEFLAQACLDIVDRLQFAEHFCLLELELLCETLTVVLILLRHQVPRQVMVVSFLSEHACEVHIVIFFVALISQQLGALEAKVLFDFAVLLFLLGTATVLLGCPPAELMRRNLQ